MDWHLTDWTSPWATNGAGRLERWDAIPPHQRQKWTRLKGGMRNGNLVPPRCNGNKCGGQCPEPKKCDCCTLPHRHQPTPTKAPASNRVTAQNERPRTMTEHYDINRLFIERPDLYDRTKLPKGHTDRLTLPKAKRIAAQEAIAPGSRLPYGIAPETARPSHALADEITKRIADRYIARVQP